MKQYLGAKLVKAEPADKSGDQGYFIEYPDGYTSWSPKAVFEEAYREVSGLTYGLAQEAMLKGFKVRCKQWVAGRFLEYVPESEYKFPYIKETFASGHVAMWLPNHVDLLASDWEIIK